jgi:hypothetical protein
MAAFRSCAGSRPFRARGKGANAGTGGEFRLFLRQELDRRLLELPRRHRAHVVAALDDRQT